MKKPLKPGTWIWTYDSGYFVFPMEITKVTPNLIIGFQYEIGRNPNDPVLIFRRYSEVFTQKKEAERAARREFKSGRTLREGF